jgi:hypothetical protein
MDKQQAIKSIIILGRRWFDRKNGNTYCASKAYVDGELVAETPYQYGYDDYYVQAAAEELMKQGLLPGIEQYDNGLTESLWQYCARVGAKLTRDVADVTEKDLKQWAGE